MRIHDEIRQALAKGLYEDNLLDVTARIAKVPSDGGGARPIVLHTILTILEGTLKRWFAGAPTEVELANQLQARLVPPVNAVLAADERGHANELMVTLDDLARTYQRCKEEFPI
jgi:hypothetical protein